MQVFRKFAPKVGLALDAANPRLPDRYLNLSQQIFIGNQKILN